MNAAGARQWSDMAETRVFATYNNIWQQIPRATPQSELFEPGNGRSVYAGLQYRF